MKFLDYIQVNPTIKLEKDKQYPFVEMANADVFAREPKQIDIKKYSSGVKFQRGDTVIARIEPCLQNGKGFFVKNISEGFGSTEFLVFRPKDDKVTNEFLYYFMLTDYIRKSMINSMTGATGRQRVNKDIFKSLELSLPSVEKQKRIADILSAYDDLIEINQKQIKLLEEAAMRLYKEWFVDLRFPGHEKSTIENSIPEDWKIVQLGEISDFKYGKMPKKDKIKDTGYPIFSGYGIVGYYDEFMFENEMLILVARGVGGTGDVKLSPCRCYLTNLSIAFLLYEEKHKYFLYQQYQYKNLRELDTGAAQSQITIENLKRHKTILPSIKIIEDFNRFFQPLHDKVLLLTEQINMLQAARDKLLPKLMSGEIEV
jgi:type I restriction enzyme S subunit